MGKVLLKADGANFWIVAKCFHKRVCKRDVACKNNRKTAQKRTTWSRFLQSYHKQCNGNLRAVVQNVVQDGQELVFRLATKVHDGKHNVACPKCNKSNGKWPQEGHRKGKGNGQCRRKGKHARVATRLNDKFAKLQTQ